VQAVAALQDLIMETLSTTRRLWIVQGLDGLSDRARNGAPVNLSVTDMGRFSPWAHDEPWHRIRYASMVFGAPGAQVVRDLAVKLDDYVLAPNEKAKARIFLKGRMLCPDGLTRSPPR
jgi:hypothetical protein